MLLRVVVVLVLLARLGPTPSNASCPTFGGFLSASRWEARLLASYPAPPLIAVNRIQSWHPPAQLGI